MKRLAVPLTLLVVFLVIAGLVVLTNSLEDGSLVIALAGPSGKGEGLAMRRAVELAVDEANYAGGVGGRPVRLKIYDGGDEPERVRLMAEEIAAGPALAVVEHAGETAAAAASGVYRNIGMPVITASMVSDAATRNSDGYFTLLPGNDFQGEFIARYIGGALGRNRAVLVSSGDAYGAALAGSFRKTAHRIGLDISLDWTFNPRDAGWESQWEEVTRRLKEMEDPGPVVLATPAAEGLHLLATLRHPGSRYEVIGADALSAPDFPERLRSLPLERAKPGYYSDGLMVMTPFLFDLGNSEAQRFRRKYRERYGEEPSWMAACAHDAARLIIEAMRAGNPAGTTETRAEDRRKIRDWLASLTLDRDAVTGVTGDLTFDRRGAITRPFAVAVYRNQGLLPAPRQFLPVTNPDANEDVLEWVLNGRLILIGDRFLARSQVVYTGVDINEIGDLDGVSQSYQVDFYLWFRYRDEFPHRDVEFLNAETPIDLSQDEQDRGQEGKDVVRFLGTRKEEGFTIQTYRIKASFQSDFDFHAYPFDHQILQVAFRHATLDRDELIYVPDFTGMRPPDDDPDGTPSYNAIPGWRVDGAYFYQDVVQNDSTLGQPRFFGDGNRIRFSRFTAAVEIRREVMGFLTKDLFTVFIMLLTLYIVYFIQSDQFELRLSIGMGVLMTNAFLHQDVSRSLQVGYLLAIENAFFTVYGLSTLSIVLSLMGSNLLREGKEPQAAALNRAGRIIHPAVILLVGAVMVYVYML